MVNCDPARPDKEIIRETVAALTDGLVVVMPTETQYSLSLRADWETAPRRISSIKKRSETIRAALFVKDLSMAERFCEISTTARRLADRFLPGPLTLVLPGRAGQDAVAPGFLSEHGFGIRMSSSPVITLVMKAATFPVTATSANLGGDITAQTADEISRILGDAVDLYVNGGPCRGVVPSTVVKVGDAVAILRHGLISETEIMKALEERE